MVAHVSGRSALIVGSAGYVPGALTGHRADVAHLDVTMRVFEELAADQAVGLHFPTVWQREDPWARSPKAPA